MSGARVPVEFQLAIITLALEAAHPRNRQGHRPQFRLVCRRLDQSIFSWKGMAPVELKQIKQLNEALEDNDDGDERRQSVRFVYVELFNPKGGGEGDERGQIVWVGRRHLPD